MASPFCSVTARQRWSCRRPTARRADRREAGVRRRCPRHSARARDGDRVRAPRRRMLGEHVVEFRWPRDLQARRCRHGERVAGGAGKDRPRGRRRRPRDPHQANLRIIESVAKRVGAPMERVYVTVQRYGNMSSATIPVSLVDALEEGRVQPGGLILMPAFGAGLTWSSHLVRWGERTTPLGTTARAASAHADRARARARPHRDQAAARIVPTPASLPPSSPKISNSRARPLCRVGRGQARGFRMRHAPAGLALALAPLCIRCANAFGMLLAPARRVRAEREVRARAP